MLTEVRLSSPTPRMRQAQSLTYGRQAQSLTYGRQAQSLTYGRQAQSLTYGRQAQSLTYGLREVGRRGKGDDPAVRPLAGARQRLGDEANHARCRECAHSSRGGEQ